MIPYILTPFRLGQRLHHIPISYFRIEFYENNFSFSSNFVFFLFKIFEFRCLSLEFEYNLCFSFLLLLPFLNINHKFFFNFADMEHSEDKRITSRGCSTQIDGPGDANTIGLRYAGRIEWIWGCCKYDTWLERLHMASIVPCRIVAALIIWQSLLEWLSAADQEKST